MKSSGRYAPLNMNLDSSSVRIEQRNMSIGQLIHWLQSKRIHLSLDFRSNANLWNKEEQSRLIESILLNIPLPSFYFEYNPDFGEYVIVDGLQRICALYNFVVLGELSLKGLDFLREYEGKKWKDLSFYSQMKFNSADIMCYIIDGSTSHNVKYVIFSRINSTSYPLNPQEIRNAMFPNVTADILYPMADLPAFRELGISCKRMNDLDFVLRFIAFYITDYNDYPGKMDFFLNQAMEKLCKFNPEEINDLITLFSKSILLARDIFGANVFRQLSDDGRKKPLSKTLFETLTVSLGKNFDEISKVNKEVFKSEYEKLLTDPAFKRALSVRPNDKRTVEIRFGETEKVIKRLIP